MISEGSEAVGAVGVKARTKATKAAAGPIVPRKEWGSQGYLATMNVLCLSEASRKMRHDLE